VSSAAHGGKVGGAESQALYGGILALGTWVAKTY
jgi:hypothetical protein